MDDLTNLRARHEAAHAIAARRARLWVKSVVASGDRPHCTTTYPRPSNRKEQIETLIKLALVDLVGSVIEGDDDDRPDPYTRRNSPAAETDRRRAFERCQQVIAIKDGLTFGSLGPEQTKRALELYAWLASEAAWAVQDNEAAIREVADRLLREGELNGHHIDEALWKAAGKLDKAAESAALSKAAA